MNKGGSTSILTLSNFVCRCFLESIYCLIGFLQCLIGFIRHNLQYHVT